MAEINRSLWLSVRSLWMMKNKVIRLSDNGKPVYVASVVLQ